MTIWIVEKLWTDALENHPSNALGYEPVGFVNTEEEVARIRIDTPLKEGTGWPISQGTSMPVFRVRPGPIPQFDMIELTKKE